MKEVIITEWDDYDLLHDGRKVHAPNTVLIGIDGKWREMDLSDENLARLHENLDPWWLCGRTPEKEVGRGPLDRSRPEPSAAPNGAQPSSKRHGTPERRAFLLGLRKWADAHGFNYTTKATDGSVHGSYYYPKTLTEAYAEYLEQQALLEKADQDPEEQRAS